MPSAPNEDDTDATMTAHVFSLTFSVGECQPDHPERAMGETCPECGAGGEEDPHVQQRWEAAAPSLAILTGATTIAPRSQSYSDATLGELREWHEQLYTLLHGIADNEDVRDALAEHVALIAGWHAHAKTNPVLRPTAWLQRAVEDVEAAMMAGVLGFLQAFTASTRAEAHEGQEAGQAGLDEAVEHLDKVVGILERWDQLLAATDGQPQNDLIALASVAYANHGPMLQVSPVANALFTSVTGAAECPPELSLALQLTDIQVELIADSRRFWTCVGIAYQRLTGPDLQGKGAILEVVKHPQWYEDLMYAHQELHDLFVDHRLLNQNSERRTRVRSQIRLGHGLAERVSPFLLSTAIAAHKGRPYEELRGGANFAKLLNEAKQSNLEALTLGLDRALRHADAHALFRIGDEKVLFTADKREYDELTFTQLQDRVLAGWESCLAIFTAIMIATYSQDEGSNPLALLDIRQEVKLEIILAMSGWTDRSISTVDDIIEISATVPENGPPVLTVMAALSTTFNDATAQLSVHVRRGAESSHWKGPVQPFKLGFPEELHAIGVLTSWKRNGQPAVTRDQTYKVLAFYALKHVAQGAEFADRMRSLKAVRDVASYVKAEQVELLMRKLQGQLRLLGQGDGSDDTWQLLVAELMSLARIDCEAFDETVF